MGGPEQNTVLRLPRVGRKFQATVPPYALVLAEPLSTEIGLPIREKGAIMDKTCG